MRYEVYKEQIVVFILTWFYNMLLKYGKCLLQSQMSLFLMKWIWKMFLNDEALRHVAASHADDFDVAAATQLASIWSL